MKKTKILSSAFVMTMVSFGAFGADTKITEASICTVDVLGVSDNNATANAIATWSLNEYTLNPGQYLNVTETDVAAATCPAGSYCVGGTGFTVDNAKNSIAQCPTGYPNSANGASADTQCYTACTLETANIAYATAVTGNDYYGTGADTCEPTACMAGWHVKPGLDIGATIGEEAGANSASINNAGSFGEMNYDGKGSKGQEYYGISGKNSFAVDYAGKGILTGHGRCSTQPGVREFDYNTNTSGEITIVDNSVDEAGMGRYCYCQVDGFTPVGGTKAIVTSAPWVYQGFRESAKDCADVCASICAYNLYIDYMSYLVWRAAVMNNLPALSATCAANTINIDWNPDNGGEHTINQCTYEGSIELPTPDPVKPGYTFAGWKLVD